MYRWIGALFFCFSLKAQAYTFYEIYHFDGNTYQGMLNTWGEKTTFSPFNLAPVSVEKIDLGYRNIDFLKTGPLKPDPEKIFSVGNYFSELTVIVKRGRDPEWNRALEWVRGFMARVVAGGFSDRTVDQLCPLDTAAFLLISPLESDGQLPLCMGLML